MDFRDLVIKRRSRRVYTGARIADDALSQIVEAGLLAPTGRNLHPAELIVVREKEMLERLSHAKTGGSALIASADAALVVVGDTTRSDTWVEDCSIMMAYMQLAAEELGIGNCWVQIRSRQSQTLLANGENLPSNAFVRAALEIPEEYDVLAILALGESEETRAPHTAEDLDWSHGARRALLSVCAAQQSPVSLKCVPIHAIV